jgi:LPS O-antigen subunit length determinant protein (WzzB/FepE family)
LRAQTIRESQTSIDYLQKEMQQTTVISLQQSIGRVLEGQMQSMALARSNEEYAFKVIDPAVAPKYRSEPKRLLILVASFMIGLVLGVTGLGIRNSFIESKIHS